ncbi:MAG: hypothetical protein HQL24_00785 [Candidatus Omnitrophica bacterium]|nr:hypothetical protein [Candidatus Omnitrophota bacterium]
MSFIHDALRKTQKNLQDINYQTPTLKNPRPPDPSLRPNLDPGNPKKNTALILLVIACVVILLLSIHISHLPPKIQAEHLHVTPAVMPVNPVPMTVTAAPAQEPVTTTAAQTVTTPTPAPTMEATQPQAVEQAPVAQVAQPQAAAPAPSIIVSGIMLLDEKKVALINNKVHQIGDTVNGGKILEISKDKVVIEIDGKPITLSVGQSY